MAVGYLNRGSSAGNSAIAADVIKWPAGSAIRGLRFEAHAGDLTYTWKRALDVSIAVALLVIVAPVAATIALLIRLTSPGPIFIRQERVGKHLRPFFMFKFRSMVVDAEIRREDLLHLNEADGPIFKIKRDPRITRVGAFLRRSSLDELPQLVNVLRGEMSIVGPRPPFPGEVEKDRFRQSQRLRCVPGMTGIWQVSGRSDLGYEAMVQMDLRYLREASVRTDLAILLRTVPAVLSGKGAW
jgi:lipopolysaccharide/colanic/teichoic acid biosynthesis glycosyltransferase